MPELDSRRIGVFLGIAFGVSWSVSGIIYALGGLDGGPTLLPGVPLWLVLLAGPYMWGPAIAHYATRVLTGDARTRDAMLLRARLPATWRYWLASWLGPLALIAAGAAVYFLVYPGRFGGLDAVASTLDAVEAETDQSVGLSPMAFVVVQVFAAAGLSPLLNSVATFGEEFGWRAYLLPKLEPLGVRRALLAHGVVWGVWHWPIIAMGYNYGLSYPGAPWTGLGTMVVATVGMGVCFGWLTLRSGTVFPAVVAHAVVNGSAGLATLFATDVPNTLLSPTPVGLLGVLPWFAVAVVVLARPSLLRPVEAFSATAATTPPDD